MPWPSGLNQQLGLSNEVFALGDSAVITVLGQVSFMPILVLAARLCPDVRLVRAALAPVVVEGRGAPNVDEPFVTFWSLV